jgi:hypothetical protein
MDEKQAALIPVEITVTSDEKYALENRLWQGIPSIEITKGNRLWAAYYSGGTGEGPDNYVIICFSDDQGNSWEKPIAVIDPPGKVRAFDPCLWMDPIGRLWLFWAQSYDLFDGRIGVWCSVCKQPDSDSPTWSASRRIANGIMMNKPTVLSDGTWCLPCAIWNFSDLKPGGLSRLPAKGFEDEGFSNVIVSCDQGKSFQIRGRADVEGRHVDEHMIVEKKDKSLWMLVRTVYGVGESFSFDKGKTWSSGQPAGFTGPNSRFFIRRLKSGRLLLVNHYKFEGRNNLTAMLSEDDGKTWIGGLLLDERNDVSYPDGTQREDGLIYITYDRDRFGAKEILYASFTEEDVLAGKIISRQGQLKKIIQ